MRGLGGEVEAEAEELDLSDVKSERDSLLFAYELTSPQLTHFLDDVTHLQTRAPQSFAASIAASEAQHLVVLRRLLGADLARIGAGGLRHRRSAATHSRVAAR